MLLYLYISWSCTQHGSYRSNGFYQHCLPWILFLCSSSLARLSHHTLPGSLPRRHTWIRRTLPPWDRILSRSHPPSLTSNIDACSCQTPDQRRACCPCCAGAWRPKQSKLFLSRIFAGPLRICAGHPRPLSLSWASWPHEWLRAFQKLSSPSCSSSTSFSLLFRLSSNWVGQSSSHAQLRASSLASWAAGIPPLASCTASPLTLQWFSPLLGGLKRLRRPTPPAHCAPPTSLCEKRLSTWLHWLDPASTLQHGSTSQHQVELQLLQASAWRSLATMWGSGMALQLHRLLAKPPPLHHSWGTMTWKIAGNTYIKCHMSTHGQGIQYFSALHWNGSFCILPCLCLYNMLHSDPILFFKKKRNKEKHISIYRPSVCKESGLDAPAAARALSPQAIHFAKRDPFCPAVSSWSSRRICLRSCSRVLGCRCCQTLPNQT